MKWWNSNMSLLCRSYTIYVNHGRTFLGCPNINVYGPNVYVGSIMESIFLISATFNVVFYETRGMIVIISDEK